MRSTTLLLVLQVAALASAATPWNEISPLLEQSDWVAYLPSPTPLSHAVSIYGAVAQTHSGGHPFTSYDINVGDVAVGATNDGIVVAGDDAVCNTTAPPLAVTAGPTFTCPRPSLP